MLSSGPDAMALVAARARTGKTAPSIWKKSENAKDRMVVARRIWWQDE